MFRLAIAPITKPLGRKLTSPAGKIAASCSVPRRETISLSTNCIMVNDMVVTTIGAANFSIYLREVSSVVWLCESRDDLSVINRNPV
ncbi:unnamed protein product, partial [marine sediment metagenome]